MPHNAFWGRSAGQVNVTRAGFAVSYFVSHTCWQPLPQRVNSVNANDSTAAGIKRLRRLKFKRCGELALRLSSRLTFACVCLVVRANHLTVNMPLRIRVGVHRVFPRPLNRPFLRNNQRITRLPHAILQRPCCETSFISHTQRIARIPYAVKKTITPLTPMYEYTIYFNAAEGICR